MARQTSKKAAKRPAGTKATVAPSPAGEKAAADKVTAPPQPKVRPKAVVETYRVRMLDRLPKGCAVMEIGVWKGDHASILLDRLEPRVLHLVDPWRFQPAYAKRWYGGAMAKSQADMDAIHDGVVARFAHRAGVLVHRKPSVDALREFEDGTLDIVFIDGDHSFECVVQDLALAQRKVRSGGYICADDWNWKDEQGRTSVRNAVLAFLQMYPFNAFHVRDNQFVLRRP